MLCRSLIAPAALLLAASLVACGGNGPTQEEYAADIDEVCERLNTDFEDLGQPESAEEIATWAAGLREVIREGVEDLEDMERPEEGEAAELAEEYVSSLREYRDETIEALEKIEEAAGESLPAAFAAMEDSSEAFENREPAEKARELGAEVCGQES